MSRLAVARSVGLLPRARRRAWRTWYALKRRLVPYRGHREPVKTTVAGVEVRVLPGVFDPARYFSSELLAGAIRSEQLDEASAVLDLGTGSGIQAMIAAERAGRVLATDIDRVALRCAQANVIHHGSDAHVSVVLGDLWEAVGDERFDLVVCNPPYQVGDPVNSLDVAFHAPSSFGGRFATGLRNHLRPGARALLLVSTNGDPDSFLRPLSSSGFLVERAVVRDRGSEILTVWRVSVPAEAVQDGQRDRLGQ